MLPPQHDGAESMELENGLSAATGSARLAERAKYIPLRLNPDERRLLRLLEVGGHARRCLQRSKLCVNMWKEPAAAAVPGCRWQCCCSKAFSGGCGDAAS